MKRLTVSMFENSPFRQDTLARSAEPEPLDGLLRITAPNEWLLLVGLVIALAGALVWSLLSSWELTVSSNGAIVRSGERHAVVTTVSGVVAEVAVAVGDRVEAGETIARVELPELDLALRTARSRLTILEERARGTEVTVGTWLDTELAAARSETLQLSSEFSAGAAIVASRTGEISAIELVEGQVVGPGTPVAEVRVGDGHASEAVLLTSNVLGAKVKPGMEARVSVTDGSGTRVYVGEVADAAPGPAALPHWLLRAGLVAPGSADPTTRLIRINLPANAEPPIPDGARCFVAIVVERQSPIGLVFSLVELRG